MAKIMLVEDDRSLQEIYSIRLVAEGYDIAKADDGEEALAKAVQEKPDLIIADVMMPKISGFDMLDILRSQPETQNIKVIMMTALSSDDQRQRGESLGAQRYLVKSQVGIEDVVNAVHEVLGDKPNDNAKANIDTLSSIPTQQAMMPNAPGAPMMQGAPAPQAAPMPQDMPMMQGTPGMPGVPNMAATPMTSPAAIQPTNQAANPAPMPANPAGDGAAMPAMNPNSGTAPMPQQMPPATQMPQSMQMPPSMQMPQSTQMPPTAQMPPNQNGGMPQNFNQAPVATPGMIQGAPVAQNPAAGATINPMVQMPNGFRIMPPSMPSSLPMPPGMQTSLSMPPTGMATMPTPTMPSMPPMPMPPMMPQMMPSRAPYMSQDNALRSPDRVLPNAQLSAQIQAAEAFARANGSKQQETKKPIGGGGNGERVIQPLHDPRLDDMRKEMESRFAEILGDDANAEGPQAINTKTARNITTSLMPPKKEQDTNAEKTADDAGMPPDIKQDPVAQAQNINLAPDTNAQQDLVRSQVAASPAPDDQPKQDKDSTTSSPEQPEEEAVEVIRPAYIEAIEEEAKEEKREAERIANPEAAQDGESDTPDFVTRAAAAAALSGPNISSEDAPTVEPSELATELESELKSPDGNLILHEDLLTDDIPDSDDDAASDELK